jgi:hypothetical protein
LARETGLKLKHSIIRRSAGVSGAFLIGHVFSYTLVFGANRILDAGGFGLFYAALLAITVLQSPTTALTFVLGRRIASENATAGPEQATRLTWVVIELCIKWGIPIAALFGVMLALAGPAIGVEAWQILLLIPGTVLAIVFVEVLRVSMQSMLLFNRANLLWLMSQGAQAFLSLALLRFSGRVWTGILGFLIGATLASAPFLTSFASAARARARLPTTATIRSLVRETPMILAYSLFILINSIDILLGYCVLSRAELDVYAGSAMLPKATVTATFAVAQVLLPVVVGQKMDGVAIHMSVLKAIVLAIAMSTAAFLVLWIATPFLQATSFAIRGLDFSMMMTMAAGAVALSALRIVVVAEGAMERYAVGLAQSAAVVVFVVLANCTRSSCGSFCSPPEQSSCCDGMAFLV